MSHIRITHKGRGANIKIPWPMYWHSYQGPQLIRPVPLGTIDLKIVPGFNKWVTLEIYEDVYECILQILSSLQYMLKQKFSDIKHKMLWHANPNSHHLTSKTVKLPNQISREGLCACCNLILINNCACLWWAKRFQTHILMAKAPGI